MPKIPLLTPNRIAPTLFQSGGIAHSWTRDNDSVNMFDPCRPSGQDTPLALGLRGSLTGRFGCLGLSTFAPGAARAAGTRSRQRKGERRAVPEFALRPGAPTMALNDSPNIGQA